MTSEKLHDALNLLPADLVAETDALRNRPMRRKIPWKHLTALAACFAVVLLTAGFFGISRSGGSKAASTEMAPAEYETAAAAEERSDYGTGFQPGTIDLMTDVPEAAADVSGGANCDAEATDFALGLLQNSMAEGENTLVSPLSVLSALGMTANGANNQTLAQMENTLGMPISDWNGWLSDYGNGRDDALKLANSIWFTNDQRFTVNPAFLETNAQYYRAGIYQTPFNQQTCDDINLWVRENTDGMIPQILDEIPEDAVMYLVNALAFEADWNFPYQEYQVHSGTFTREDGTQREAEMMYSQENVYLEDENATGFLKYYQGAQYAFVALLPNGGVSVSDYVQSLTGSHLRDLLENKTYTEVNAALPKFETGYSVELSQPLQAMGITDAFDPAWADFSNLGSFGGEPIYISRVLHKTFISVAEQGTRAGAATVVEAAAGAAAPQEPKRVILDRPFVYMIVDCYQHFPIFIGTMMDTGA